MTERSIGLRVRRLEFFRSFSSIRGRSYRISVERDANLDENGMSRRITQCDLRTVTRSWGYFWFYRRTSGEREVIVTSVGGVV